jgi:hypothetical protein
MSDIEYRRFDESALWRAVNRTQPLLLLAPDGTIAGANADTLAVSGRVRAALIGRHRAAPCDPAPAAFGNYRRPWDWPARPEGKVRALLQEVETFQARL